MAQVVISITDQEGGGVNVNVKTDPPLTTHGQRTPAQSYAQSLLFMPTFFAANSTFRCERRSYAGEPNPYRTTG